MKWNQSRIKAEAIALYGEKHPEVRLEDLGTAFGMTKAAVSQALIRHGVKREIGQRAAAYTQPVSRNNQIHDHAAILKTIKDRPDLRYREIGEMCGCDWPVVAYVAHKNGIYRGFRRAKAAGAK
jgi:hypothetical protein